MSHNQQPAPNGFEAGVQPPKINNFEIIGTDELDKPQDECGVFGILAYDREVGAIAWRAGIAQEHRGLSGSGIAYYDHFTDSMCIEKGVGDMHQAIPHMEPGLVQTPPDQVFSHLAIVHNRYSTAGNKEGNSGTQPAQSQDVTLAHNGHMDMGSLERLARNCGVDPSEAPTDSHLLARIIGKHVSFTNNIQQTLTEILPHVRGAFCLSIAYKDTLIGVRDNHGVHPLSVGRIASGGGVIASETVALQPAIVGDLEWTREVQPGEMVFISRNDVESARFTNEPTVQKHCLFESIYTADETSEIWGTDVRLSRFNMGKKLAEVAPVMADLVIGVPNSGIPAGKGYAETAEIPYSQAIRKSDDPTVKRTFILGPAERAAMLRKKFIIDEAVIRGKRLVVTDDSMIKGNSMRALTERLWEAGALEVHLRFAAPRFESICNLGIDAAKLEELIAQPGKMDTTIAAELGVSSVAFNSFENVEAAINEARLDPRTPSLIGKFCRACTMGEYHDTVPLEIQIARQRQTGHRVLALTAV